MWSPWSALRHTVYASKGNQGKMDKRADALIKTIEARLKTPATNQVRRRLSAEVSLLELDVEDDDKMSDADKSRIQSLLAELQSKLELRFVERKGALQVTFDLLDEFVRIAAVWLFLVDSAFLLAIPAVILDITYPNQKLTIYAKQFVGKMCLLLSAVTLTVTGLEGETEEKFCSSVNLLCFSHASTMDAFILSAAVPVRHYSLAKSALFAIPFFSWHLAAYGGVAIDRSNKEQAVRALAAAAASAHNGDCVAVAPEGTRSTTGHLVSFKKGPFYLWETLKCPIIPAVIYGAFELYPPGTQMSLPGRVVMQFLQPIQPSEATTREGMSRIVRRRMLTAIQNAPDDVGDTATVGMWDRGGSFAAIAAIFSLNAFVLVFLVDTLRRENVSLLSFAMAATACVGGVTAALYGYKTYVSPRMLKAKSL